MIGILQGRADLNDARFVLGDALSFDYDANARDAWCACGNLPYNVATPLILRWLALQYPPSRIVAMVQRDVALRLTARPNTAAYGSLSVLVQFSMHVHRALALGPDAFYPRPRVESAVVTMERRNAPAVAVRDVAFFLQVVRGAFAYRRKTLVNSLALALGIERLHTQRVLADIGLGNDTRAEQLDLDAFGAIADRLAA